MNLARELASIDTRMTRSDNDPNLALSLNASEHLARPTRDESTNSAMISRQATIASQLTYTLYDFGRQNTKLAKSEHAEKIANSTRDKIQEEIFWRVIRAYFDVAATSRLSKIAKEQLAVTKARLAQQKLNYRNGLRPKSDVLMAEVDYGKSQIAFHQATLDNDSAKLHLSILITPELNSLGPSSDIEVATDGVSTQGPQAWDQIIEQLREDSLSARERHITLELQELYIAQDILDSEILPILNTSILVEYTSARNTHFTPMRPKASGKVEFIWDIPWNGIHRDKKERLSVRKRDYETQLAIVRKERLQVVAQATQKLSSAKQHYHLLENQINITKQQQKLVNQRYLAGQATALELSAVESALLSMLLDRAKLSNLVSDTMIELAHARGINNLRILSKI